MSKEPIVSFVIPVYDKPPEVFEKCLESLFDQSLKEIEVIAVFDGENKELEAVADKFKRVKKLVVPHGGASKARNAGMDIATGKYIACWDSDCFAKPGMAKRWIEEFDANPDADFVYSGYEFTGERGGFDSETFDTYSLTCGNYISSMAPIKREKAPRWDESLEGAQDWDFWLTAVENGCKGVFIEGPGFSTDPGDKGISSNAWSTENREETIRIVREKHGIHDREIGVYSMSYAPRALKLAKLLGADLIKQTGPHPKRYRMIFNLGYGYLSRFEDAAPDAVRVQYWIPGEIAGLAEAKYSTVLETIRIAKGTHNFCNTVYEQTKLADLGISAEILPLALHQDDLAKVQDKLPEDFSALILADEAYAKLLTELQIDLPYIKFGTAAGKIADYSCVISFYTFAALDEPILVAHVNGRHVISNIQAPYCGYIDPAQSWDDFKKDLYQKIREAKGKHFNKEAQAYYLQMFAPDKFKERVTSLMAPVLEVVA
jgi:glycosyltransferase involved in cell wall biosynthesis